MWEEKKKKKKKKRKKKTEKQKILKILFFVAPLRFLFLLQFPESLHCRILKFQVFDFASNQSISEMDTEF